MNNPNAINGIFPFKSEKFKSEYLSFHKKYSLQWPVPYDERMYRTSFGQTYVRITGQENAEPLILMHGGGDNSASWAPNVESLAKKYHVYAIDLINGSNMSICMKPINTIDDMLSWLRELCITMGIDTPCSMMGMSYGSYIIARYMLKYPDKIKKAVLIAPPNFVVSNDIKFIFGVLSTILPGKYFTRKFFHWCFKDLAESTDIDGVKIINMYIDNALLIRKCFAIQKFINPVVLSEGELRSITTPTYFLIGENDINYSAGKAVKKLNVINGRIKTEVFAEAGHDLPILKASVVNQRIQDFLDA